MRESRRRVMMSRRKREREREREREATTRNGESARGRAKEGGSSEIDSGRARRRRVVGSSRVTSGRAGAAPGSCGVCRRPEGEGVVGREGGCCCTSTRPFCVPIRPPEPSRSPSPPTRNRVTAILPACRPGVHPPARHHPPFFLSCCIVTSVRSLIRLV